MTTVAKPATITAISGSYMDVNNALSASSSGDTIIIPAGTYAWTKTLNVSGVTLQGSGTNSTIIVDETPSFTSASVIQISSISSTLTRVTGIQFTHGITNNLNVANFNGFITVFGGQPFWRIDNCFFNQTASKGILVGDASYGLIDHNTFLGSNHNYIEINDTGFGDLSWSLPTQAGSTNMVYVESNYFRDTANFGFIDVANGGRCCFRYNTGLGFWITNHGTETGQRTRSCRWFEIYNNSLTYPSAFAFDNFYTGIDMRGGSGVIFSNTFTGFNALVTPDSYRATDNDLNFTPWFGATGINGYDSNSAALLNGTASATSNSLYVASAAWTANQWYGCTVYNSNSVNGLKLCGIVTGNDAKTMTFKVSRVAAYQLFFTNGDPFVVHMAYPQIDQVGMGRGDLLSGNVPAAVWGNEQPEIVYCWSNTLVRMLNQLTVIDSSMLSGYPNILNGRDFTNTARPNYSPLVFPNPASSGTNVSPPSPAINSFSGGLLMPLGNYGASVNFILPVTYIDITNGLIAWYPLAGNVNDLSTNGNNGTAVGSPVYTNGVLGTANTALFFKTNQYVQTPLTNIAFASGTISWWMRPANDASNGTTRVFWGQLNNGNSAPEFSAQVFLDNNFYMGWNSGTDARIVTPAGVSNYQNGVWRLYTFTWTGAGSIFYVNGVPIALSGTAQPVTNIGYKFNINQYSTTLINGSTDAQAGFRIYNRALTGVEVGTIYANGIGGGIF
jgi:hypothetical protein